MKYCINLLRVGVVSLLYVDLVIHHRYNVGIFSVGSQPPPGERPAICPAERYFYFLSFQVQTDKIIFRITTIKDSKELEMFLPTPLLEV